MSLAAAVNALSSLSAVAVAAALLLNLAIQFQRDQVKGNGNGTDQGQAGTDLLLAILSFALLIWGVIGSAALLNRSALGASALVATTLLYFLFIDQEVRSKNTLATLLMLATPITLIVCMVLIWAMEGVSGDTTPVMSSAGNVALILMVIYAAAALWAILSSRATQGSRVSLNSPTEGAARFRGAGLLMIAGCASALIFPQGLFSVTLLLITAAVGWIGWSVIREQLFRPIDEQREELRIANRDLRQAVSEIASLRARHEILSQEIQAAGQYRSEFLDKLGHKLRTPLNSITGYTELLESGLYGDLNEKQIDRLGKIQRNSENLLDLISNMLDLNTINAGRLELKKTNFAMNGVIEQATKTLDGRRSEKTLTLTCNLDPALPPVYGDETRVGQVVTQMVDNALKFTFEGMVTIHSRSIRVDKGVSTQFPLPLKGWLGDGDWVLVEVNDTGIGIAPEDQAKIFDEFYQITDPRTEEYFGTGLGLTIAKRLTELHEGVLWAKSTPAEGSTFYLALRAQAQHSL